MKLDLIIFYPSSGFMFEKIIGKDLINNKQADRMKKDSFKLAKIF